jgi:hypothetical protein
MKFATAVTTLPTMILLDEHASKTGVLYIPEPAAVDILDHSQDLTRRV